jgi:hypothetical protein
MKEEAIEFASLARELELNLPKNNHTNALVFLVRVILVVIDIFDTIVVVV